MTDLIKQEALDYVLAAEVLRRQADMKGYAQMLQDMEARFGQGAGLEIFNAGRKLLASPSTAALPWEERAFEETLAPWIAQEPSIDYTPTPVGAARTFAGSVLGGLTKIGKPAADIQATNELIDAQAQLNPIAARTGSLLGEMIPPAAMQAGLTAIPGGRVIDALSRSQAFGPTAVRELIKRQGPVLAGATTGAAEGLLREDIDPTAAALLGAAGTKLGEAAYGRVAAPTSLQSQGTKKLIRAQRKKGYWANPGLRTNRKGHRQLDQALATNPETAPAVAARRTHNQRLFNKEIGEAIGLKDAFELDYPILEMQAQQIGDRLDKFYAGHMPKFGRGDNLVASRELAKFASNKGVDIGALRKSRHPINVFGERIEYLRKLSKSPSNKKNVNRLFRELRSNLSQQATYNLTSMSGDPVLGRAYSNMLDMLDRAMMRAAPKAEAESWKSAREQYAFLKEILKDKSVIISGNVSPAAILKLFRTSKGFNRGYIDKRRNIFDAATFLMKQDESFESSLSMQQRIATYLNPQHRKGGLDMLSTVTVPIPFINRLMSSLYLGGAGMIGIPPSRAGLLGAGATGGALGITAGDYTFSDGVTPGIP